LTPNGDMLVNSLLTSILEQQRENATTLGRIDQTVTDLKENQSGIAHDLSKLTARVVKLEHKDIRRAGYIAGVWTAAQIGWHYLKKNLGW
jgi:hypothetical protein